MHRDYKEAPNIVLRKGHISVPLILDFRAEPTIIEGEDRKIAIRMSTKESLKLFVKDSIVYGKK